MSWKSSKQTIIVNSMKVAKYMATSDTAKEAILLKKFITNLIIVLMISNLIHLLYDNNGAIANAKEPRSN